MIGLLKLKGNKAFVSWRPGCQYSTLAVVDVDDDGISTCPMCSDDQMEMIGVEPSQTFDSIQSLAAHVRGE